jgi:peptidoglycan/LPS O-acetylase OafA/YrhL
MRNERYQGLDGLRGIAALSIAVFHFYGNWGGYLAVDLFLILSGFVLAHRHRVRQESPAEFIVARIARLYPLHIVTMCLFLLVAIVTGLEDPLYHGDLFSVVLQQLTLTHNIGLNPGGLNFNYPSWSVSVEFWINVVFIMTLVYVRKVYWLLIPAAIGFLSILFQVSHLNVHYQNLFGVLNLGLLRGVAFFFVGVVLYREHEKRERPTDIVLDLVSVFAMISVAIVVFIRPDVQFVSDFLVMPLFILLIYSVSYDTGRVASVLARLSPLGEISYSIYLNQILVLISVRWLGEMIGINVYLMFLLYLAALLSLSRQTYAWIELPLKSMVGRFLHSRLPVSMKSGT